MEQNNLPTIRFTEPHPPPAAWIWTGEWGGQADAELQIRGRILVSSLLRFAMKLLVAAVLACLDPAAPGAGNASQRGCTRWIIFFERKKINFIFSPLHILSPLWITRLFIQSSGVWSFRKKLYLFSHARWGIRVRVKWRETSQTATVEICQIAVDSN